MRIKFGLSVVAYFVDCQVDQSADIVMHVFKLCWAVRENMESICMCSNKVGVQHPMFIVC